MPDINLKLGNLLSDGVSREAYLKIKSTDYLVYHPELHACSLFISPHSDKDAIYLGGRIL
jgi:hypothetical protein